MFKTLIGSKVEKIFMNEKYLKFETNNGNEVFEVEGDCCSWSVFYDFIGVKKLLNNKLVKFVEEIDLKVDVSEDTKKYNECIEVYGYRIITEDPEFGEVSSVFSFRNYSNGYYGGWMEQADSNIKVLPEVTGDVLSTD